MNSQMEKELYLMGQLIDGISLSGEKTECGPYFFYPYFEDDNVVIVKNRQRKEVIRDFMLPSNTDSSELDWWILFAAATLRVCTSQDIVRFLTKLKKKHPNLMYTGDTELKRMVTRRVNQLVTMELLQRYIYVAGTTVPLYEAQQIYEMKLKMEDKQKGVSANISYDIDDDFEEYSKEMPTEGVEYMEFSQKDVTNYHGREKKYVDGNREYGHALYLRAKANKTLRTEIFGPKTRIMDMLQITDVGYGILHERFGAGISSYNGSYEARLASEKIAQGSVAYLASYLCELDSFHGIKTGRLISKTIGEFCMPIEFEFRKILKNGEEMTYFCGMISSYYTTGSGKRLVQHDKAQFYHKVDMVKNYIGIKGLKKTNKEAFVIVSVNDMTDLYRFADAMMDKGLTVAECNRVFFTAQGLIDSDYGLRKMIGLNKDEESREYTLHPVSIPIL